MEVRRETRGGRLVLTPGDALISAGTAEQFGSLLQNVLAEGHRHLVIDLEHVAHIDSSGISALIRGHLTAQRAGGSIALASMDRRVSRVLTLMRLDRVFPMFPNVDAAVADTPVDV